MNRVLLSLGLCLFTSVIAHAATAETQNDGTGWECEATGRPSFAVHDYRYPIWGDRKSTETKAKASALEACEAAHYSVCRLAGCWHHE